MNRPAAEQPRARVPHVGFITIGRAGTHATPNLLSFLQGLREHGWVDGENITVEFLFAEPWEDQHPALATDLVRRGVDVICCSGLPAIRAAKAATSTVPIVMVVEGGDAVAAGLVDNLERPSGNVTGQTSHFAQISGKRLEILKAMLPGLGKVAVLWNPTAPDKVADWNLTQAAGRELDLELLSLEVQTPEDLPGAFDTATAAHADGLLVLSDPLTWRTRRRILGRAYPTCTAARPPTWISYSVALGPRTCLSRDQRASSWSSIRRQPVRSGSRFQKRCSRPRTRSLASVRCDCLALSYNRCRVRDMNPEIS
jgi:ABC transporter substrate binding protein